VPAAGGVLHAADASGIVDAIRRAARTGHQGDGMIFVSPAAGACRIRTGAWGVDALREPGEA